jgi:hypothetical protein
VSNVALERYRRIRNSVELRVYSAALHQAKQEATSGSFGFSLVLARIGYGVGEDVGSNIRWVGEGTSAQERRFQASTWLGE